MTIERAADAILRSDWPGYREAMSESEWNRHEANAQALHNAIHGRDLVIDRSGAWETYAAQSARLAHKERCEAMWIKVQIAMVMAANTAIAFGLGVWWGRS
jgi:hypothetical protein